jgi:hypothetical protein
LAKHKEEDRIKMARKMSFMSDPITYSAWLSYGEGKYS